MSYQPLRFVHAGDFHLETPPQGLTEVPDHLRELFLESAYWAAERVFENVLAEEAQFLVLSGDLLNPKLTGPRGPLFLMEQFGRLAERNIPVYWAGGRVDPPDAWPSAFELPANVHRFPVGGVQDFIFPDDGTPAARLSGTSRGRKRAIRPKDFEPDAAGLCTIAVANGTLPSGTGGAAGLKSRGIDYWALGGRYGRSTPLSSPHVAHYPGTPQGRRPEHQGVHGCTLVEVDQDRLARPRLIPTDVMRWVGQRLVVDDATTQEDFENMFRERIGTLVDTTPGVDLLICWQVAGSGPLLTRLRRGGLDNDLLGWLRSEFGYGPPAAWSVSIEVEFSGGEITSGIPSRWFEQETIRGDFLRAVRQLQLDPQQPLEIDAFLAEEHRGGKLGPAIGEIGKSARGRVLQEAALLGVDLLTSEEARP